MQAAEKAKMPFFVPGDLDLDIQTLRARDQTRLPCEFGANPFSGSPRYFTHKEKSHRQHQKQNPTQFTACGTKQT